MTTTPVDMRAREPHDRQEPTGAVESTDPPAVVGHEVDGVDGPAPETKGDPEIGRFRGRGVLPGVLYPLVVFALWRVAQQILLVVVGGRGTETAYNYDGEHYLRILHHGYWDPRPVMPSHAFFPGISWLATPIYRLTGSDQLAVHTTITLTGAAAFVAVWGATKAWKNEVIARRAVILMALFPSSIFLWMFYSEGLFIALGAGAVWADRKGRHGIAAACLLAIGTTRSVGIVVPAVIVLARIIRVRRVDKWVVIYALAGVSGLGLVLLVMWHQTGDAFAWLRVQGDWGRSVAWPWSSVTQGVQNLYPEPETVMVPALVARNFDLWAVPIVLAPIFYAGFSRKDKYPVETWMLGAGMIALGLCSSVLASFNRFVMADWIIYPVYASFAGRLPRWTRWVLFGVLGAISLWTTWHLVDRFAAERFVG